MSVCRRLESTESIPPGEQNGTSMDSILKLASPPTVVALVQAHSHKKLIGISPAADIWLERSSQAPGVGLGRNCRSLQGDCAVISINHANRLCE